MERGFTVIEVMMFLAISGLLLVGAMAGVSGNISNTRFNDAVNSTTSYVQQQYGEVSNGKNDREATRSCDASVAVGNGNIAPGMTNCVVLGRFIKLQGTQLTSRYILGYAATLNGLPQDDTLAIRQLNPKIAPDSAYAGSFDVPWNVAVSRSKINGGATPASLGLAIVRSPVSNNILFYSYDANGAAEPNDLLTLINTANINRDVTVCFQDDAVSRRGNMTIASGQGQEVIQTVLDATAGDCS